MGRRIDIDTQESKHRGVKGLFERLLRRFKNGMHLAAMVPVYLAGITILGICLLPGITLFRAVLEGTNGQPILLQNFALGSSIATGFLLYGLSLIFLAPLVNRLIGGHLKPWRGPYHSAEAFKWFLHNALTYLVRFTFLEFVTPSPISVLFYRMMGMKVGRLVAINTTWISDPSLIEIGDKVTLGGSVTIVAHYGQGGLLVIAPVKIGNGCTIGLKASIMGGVTIGDGARVLPQSVVLPKTVIPAGETWGGVPACKIDLKPTLRSLKSASSS